MSEELEERAQRIVETAVELAEQGGFEAVRLRDVASHAGVALGTLYRRFRSKEDLLVAALEIETRNLERRFAQRPPKGDDPVERVMAFFGLLIKGLLRRPNLGRACLKAASSGEPELAKKVAAYHQHIEHMIVMSLRGAVARENGELADPKPSLQEERVADTLNQVCFGLLVGWSGGVHGQGVVMEKLRVASEIVIRGGWEIE